MINTRICKGLFWGCMASGLLLAVVWMCENFEYKYYADMHSKEISLGRNFLSLKMGNSSSNSHVRIQLFDYFYSRYYDKRRGKVDAIIYGTRRERIEHMISYYENENPCHKESTDCERKIERETYYYPDGKVLCEIDYGDPGEYWEYYHGEMKTYTKDGAILTSGKYEKGYPAEGTFLSCRDDKPAWVPGRCHDKYILTYKDGELVDVTEEKKSFLDDCPEEIKKINWMYRCRTKLNDERRAAIEKELEEENKKMEEEKEKNRPKFPWDKDEAEEKADNKK